MASHRVDLVDEGLDCPQGGVVRQVGFSTAELVVEDRAPAGRSHCLERLEIVMRPAGAAVQIEDRQLPFGLAVSDDAVPRFVAPEGDVPLVVVHPLWGDGTGCEGPDGSVGTADSSAACGVWRSETDTCRTGALPPVS